MNTMKDAPERIYTATPISNHIFLIYIYSQNE